VSRIGKRFASTSLRQRLTLLSVVTFSAALSVLGAVVPHLVGSFLTDRLDQDLVRSEQRAVRALNIAFSNPDDAQLRLGTADADSYYEFRDANGQLLVSVDSESFAAPKLPAAYLTPALSHPVTVDSIDGTIHWRVLAFVPAGVAQTTARGFFVTAIPTRSVDDTVSATTRVVIVAALSALAVFGVLTFVLVGVGLRPLRAMQRAADGISSAGDLHQRVDQPSEKTELGQLAGTLNGMLARLETSFDEQQQGQARLRRFVSDASHELRTPLTSIRGYAELHRRGYTDPEQVDRSMERIEQESSRMSRLVDDLLSLARADERQHQPFAAVRVDEIVSGLAEDFGVVHPDRAVAVTLSPCTVMGDGGLLTQAVVNVLANAGSHTPPETPVEIDLRIDAANCVLTISDHGPGIAAEDSALVFDRFYRSDTSRTRQSGGSGLGLAITDSIVAAHGGTVANSPTPGGGATFTITLPLAEIATPVTDPLPSPG
jgi:two-component system, OmpR family, sensor kinase